MVRSATGRAPTPPAPVAVGVAIRTVAAVAIAFWYSGQSNGLTMLPCGCYNMLLA